MAITTVSDREALLREIKFAKAGDTILLESGTYANMKIANVNIAGDVYIMSKDPGAPAVVTGLEIRNSSGLNFSNLEFALDVAKASPSLNVYDSRDIHFDRLNVHGSLDGNPQNDGGAMLIRNSSDVSVTNSEFQQFTNGVTHLDSNNVTISGNRIHDIKEDGVRGGGTSNITISNNHFSNFFPAALDHPDAIQFWTANTTTSAHDILISGNVIERGDGGTYQGIFLGGDLALRWLNVKITDNLVIGSSWHGITVGEGDNVLLANNIVAGYADIKARITLADDINVTLTNNQATDYVRQGAMEFDIDTGNTTIAVVTKAGGDALLAEWLKTHSASAPAPTDGGLSLPEQWSFEPDAVPGGLPALIATSLDTLNPPFSPNPPTTELPGGPEAPISLSFDFGQFGFSFF
ncbi:right-handed parallel beta-helix repeat-containing protein [Phenylobacterium sp. LH3H17]|uniref:right-handed parallel beta-helix repeat-containing protein n=1 Tax=Phenylobacterium sp. LH3H17 TaxID=2903901 RepID=UPI0020C9F1EB|nr:right-handed parallel beta-helix repeat-containing protein [Phenylobacterium sp. LH3H17]UTP40955.1 right-handed parallel beta-helix repeat-containing protein [Phenylobacterium sp. LH3H17]